jgi:hypothetical protein
VVAAKQPRCVQIDDDDDRLVFSRPAPTGLDDVIDPLPWDELTNLDAAHIVIQNMVRLEALLGGASVVESKYTCLYAHRPATCHGRYEVSFNGTRVFDRANSSHFETKNERDYCSECGLCFYSHPSRTYGNDKEHNTERRHL